MVIEMFEHTKKIKDAETRYVLMQHKKALFLGIIIDIVLLIIILIRL